VFGALAAYDVAIQLEPRYAHQFWARKAHILVKMRRLKEAWAAFKLALAPIPAEAAAPSVEDS
jgi:hypothetical protein